MIPQKSFGEFTTERFGRNWVYAARMTDRIRRQYDKQDCPAVVITPKEQRQLAADYKAQWGRENDEAGWAMICALRAIHARGNDCPAGVATTAYDALKAAGVSP